MTDPSENQKEAWLGNFGYVLELSAIRDFGREPEFQAFAGSKWLAFPWLAVVAAVAGALGGILVSGALWSVWWQVPLAFVALAAFTAAVLRATIAAYERAIYALAGWCLFFGLLIGAFTMWAAQLESSGWAYLIAGGAVFLLIGITGADLPPPYSKRMEDWFLTSALAAPAASCLAVYSYRNGLDVGGLAPAALAGGLAGALFLSVVTGLYLLAWKPGRGLLRSAILYLHSDETAQESVRLFERVLQVEAPTANLYARRGLAHALAGNSAAAEADWAKAAELEPHGAEPHLSRGWSALRRGDPEAAKRAFLAALERRDGNVMALVGLGLANLGLKNSPAALDALGRIRAESHDALSRAYLAEAQLMAGDAKAALETVTAALGDERTSHARPRIVRAEALRALGDIECAVKDYNWALSAKDEVGTRERAVAGLDEIRRGASEGGSA